MTWKGQRDANEGGWRRGWPEHRWWRDNGFAVGVVDWHGAVTGAGA
jgi:hypothetical protein